VVHFTALFRMALTIARALLGSPGLMLFDEPSQGLAPRIVGGVLDMIRRLRATGIASIVVEQHADVSLPVADHVVVLHVSKVYRRGLFTRLPAFQLDVTLQRYGVYIPGRSFISSTARASVSARGA
jgi:branched-chain amino acid transport system ATP-binding protein